MPPIKDPITPEIIKSPGKYAEEILKAVKATNLLVESLIKLKEVNDKIPPSDDNAAKKKRQLTEVEKEANRIRTQQLQTHAKLDKARSREVVALQKAKIKLQETNKEVKNSIVESKRSVLAVEAQKGAYNAISKALSANLIKWKQLTKAERETTVAGQKLTATIKTQRAELAKADKSTGLAARGVGKYKEGVLGAAKSLFGALGLIGGIAGLTKALGSAIMISLQFEASMAKVRAISGASATEFKALRDQAKFLGEQTQKTAAQAAQLQIELSKIGFSPKQIINSTNAILELSIATGEDLAQSAKVAAGTLKAFNKDAEDAQQITDIMAKSFSSSALDLSKFETAASAAAPTLQAMGVTVERMTAQLSVLVDRNIDASTAGTGLRNVYLDLNKHGMTLTEALEDINNSSNKANRAFELFGKRGATVAVVLAENQDQADELTRSYELAAGSAEKMAKIMIDNLKGDTDKATSAMQGLAINLGEQLTPALRSVTQGFTNIVSALSEFAKIGNEELLKEEQLNVNKLAIELTNANTTLLRRNEIYEELQDIAPEVIENIDFENVSIVTLRGNLEKYNQTLIKKLALSETEVLKSEANIEASEALEERLKKEDNARSLLFKTQEKANEQGGEFKKTIDDIILSSIPLEDKLVKTKAALADQVDGFGTSQLEMAKFRTQTALFSDAIRELTTAQVDEEKATQKASDAVQAYTDRYNRIFGADAPTDNIAKFIGKLIDLNDALDEEEFEKQFHIELIADIKAGKEAAKALEDQKKEVNKQFKGLDKVLSDNRVRTNIDMLNSDKDFQQKEIDKLKQTSDEKIKIIQAEAKQREQIAEMVKDATIDLTAQGAQAITDLLLESSSQRRDEQLERIDEQREEDLERVDEQTQEDLANEDAKVEAGIQTEEQAAERKDRILEASTAEKSRIEAEADTKSSVIKTKQARAEKAAAIAQIAIDTAIGIIKYTSNPLTLPLVPFVIAAGALQTAAVLATPIPQFFKGTSNAPSGTISVSEKGSELIIPKTGDPFMSPDSQTFYSNLQGAEIVPNHQVKERLAEMGSKGQSFNFSDNRMVDAINKNTKAVNKQSRSNTVDNVTTSRIGNRLVKKHNSLLSSMKR